MPSRKRLRRRHRRRRRPRSRAPPTTWRKEHGLRRIAVLEKGWIGGGNTGRNTTIIRSNYLYDESAALYDHAVKLWEGLSQVLNYNVMFSPARRDDAGAYRARRCSLQASRARQSLQRRRQRMARAGSRPRPSARRSTSIPTSAIRCWARRCSGAAAPRATTRWPGAMRAPPMRSASTSSRTAR